MNMTIIIGRIKGLNNNDDDDYPTNEYRIESTVEGGEILASPISIMGNNDSKNAGFFPSFSQDELVLVFLDSPNHGYILGAVDGTTGRGPLANETILIEKGGAKIHMGDAEGFSSIASGAGSLTLVAQRLAIGVGDVEEYSQNVNEEYFGSDYQDNPTIPYTPDFPEEGFYIETDQGDNFHMASGTIVIKSSEANGTEIKINSDGTIDIKSHGAINVDSGGNVVFQGGNKSVAADGDTITIQGGILTFTGAVLTCLAGNIVGCPVMGGTPIPVLAGTTLTDVTPVVYHWTGTEYVFYPSGGLDVGLPVGASFFGTVAFL